MSEQCGHAWRTKHRPWSEQMIWRGGSWVWFCECGEQFWPNDERVPDWRNSTVPRERPNDPVPHQATFALHVPAGHCVQPQTGPPVVGHVLGEVLNVVRLDLLTSSTRATARASCGPGYSA